MNKAIKIKIANETMLYKVKNCLIFWDDECPFADNKDIKCPNEGIDGFYRENCEICINENVKFKIK